MTKVELEARIKQLEQEIGYLRGVIANLSRHERVIPHPAPCPPPVPWTPTPHPITPRPRWEYDCTPRITRHASGSSLS